MGEPRPGAPENFGPEDTDRKTPRRKRTYVMPNHKSAEKRDRQNAKRNAINTTNRSRLRTAIKQLRAVIAAGQAQEAQAALSKTVSAIDKSVQKGVLHKNTAARHKARLTSRVNQLTTK